MKNSNSFRFKINALTWILLALLLAISLLGVGFNIYNIVLLAKAELTSIAIKVVTLSVCVLLFALTLSIMLCSKYAVKNGYLYCYFGFVRSKTKLDDILQLTLFKKNDKLVAYFKDGKYTIIVIAPEKYDEFTKAVRAFNPNIVFDIEEA